MFPCGESEEVSTIVHLNIASEKPHERFVDELGIAPHHP